MKIGILECGHTIDEIAQRHGQFPNMFARLLGGHGFEFNAFDVENMRFPASVRACDGWLLTGSKHGVYEDHPFIARLEDFVREAYEQHVPMVGICFGHQIIAQALGGKVQKFDGGWALGHHKYDFDGLGTLALNAWHQDQVIELPDGAEAIAESAFCKNAALVYDKRALSVQPHPEFGGDIISDYARLRRGNPEYPDALLDLAAQNSSEPDDNQIIAQQIADFFKQDRGGQDG